MKPKSLSASAVKNFEGCPARWLAESHAKTPSPSGDAANLGTAVHGALEGFVKIGASHDPSARPDQLVSLFDGEYYSLFGTDHSRLEEGREMLRDWFERMHPLEKEVLSTEVKEHFMLKTSIGEIPFNFIWDRCDYDEPNHEIDVVDYKTIMRPLSVDQMRSSIQVRAYALAAAIKFKDLDPQRVWVTLDMLRHGDPVSVAFTREDNKETWDYLHNVAERVIAMDVSEPEERINSECKWCIRKHVCKTLKAHATAGGVHGMTDINEIVKKRAELDSVSKAIKAAVQELDAAIIQHAEKEDVLEFTTDEMKVLIRARRTRNVDGSQIKKAIPDELWAKYGKEDMTMAGFDKLLKDPQLSDEDRSALKQYVKIKMSNPFVITEEVAPLDEA